MRAHDWFSASIAFCGAFLSAIATFILALWDIASNEPHDELTIYVNHYGEFYYEIALLILLIGFGAFVMMLEMRRYWAIKRQQVCICCGEPKL
jgi:ABC-type amino acid transport system permease subunit